MNLSPLQKARYEYTPKLPGMLRNGIADICVKEGEETQSVADQEKIKALFPNTYGKKEITFEDISIYYDIHSEFEMDIIKNIESTFENLNQVVLIRQTYNNLVEQIVSKCKSKKIKYKLEPEGVKLKYSDLLKLDITYLITDFVWIGKIERKLIDWHLFF